MSVNPTVVNLKDQRAGKLAEEITALYGLITAATYDLLAKIREFDRDELWAGPGLASCAHWLNWQCGIGMNAAREKVRVARALGDLPKISEAFRLGEVSFSKVRAMTRVATPDNEDYLLMIARHGTANHVEQLIRGYRRAVRLNDAGSAEQQHATRSFNYHWDCDGSLVFKGRLPAEVGAMLMNALQASIDRKEKEVTAVTPSDSEDRCHESLSQRRADAIAEMSETYLASGPSSSSSADRYQVMLHVYPEGKTFAEPSATHIEDGPDVTAETSRRICCDTSVTQLIEDEEDEPLSIGRKSRVIPAAMRRALRSRDRQCRFPGCTHKHFIDGHHIRHWADGGETSLDNLVQLCRYHHRLVHEGGYCCEKNDEGTVVFRDREGQLVPETGRIHCLPRGHADVGNVMVLLEEQLEDRFIDEQTIKPYWHGETMDKDIAVGLLWDIDHRATLPRS